MLCVAQRQNREYTALQALTLANLAHSVLTRRANTHQEDSRQLPHVAVPAFFAKIRHFGSQIEKQRYVRFLLQHGRYAVHEVQISKTNRVKADAERLKLFNCRLILAKQNKGWANPGRANTDPRRKKNFKFK